MRVFSLAVTFRNNSRAGLSLPMVRSLVISGTDRDYVFLHANRDRGPRLMQGGDGEVPFFGRKSPFGCVCSEL